MGNECDVNRWDKEEAVSRLKQTPQRTQSHATKSILEYVRIENITDIKQFSFQLTEQQSRNWWPVLRSMIT